MSLSQGMMAAIERQAVVDGFARVTLVRLEIGTLAGVEPEALRFCFDAVTRGTVAEGAGLDIVAVPGQAWCWDCEQVVTIGRHGDACPRCGGYGLEVRGGDELRLKELEVH